MHQSHVWREVAPIFFWNATSLRNEHAYKRALREYLTIYRGVRF